MMKVLILLATVLSLSTAHTGYRCDITVGSVGECPDHDAPIAMYTNGRFQTCWAMAHHFSAQGLCIQNENIRDIACVCTCQRLPCARGIITTPRPILGGEPTTPHPTDSQKNGLFGGGGGRGGDLCFSSDATMTTRNGQVVKMVDVAPGTEVQVVLDDNSIGYQPIRMFQHRDPDRSARFLEINTQKGSTLSLTPRHLLFKTSCDGSGSRELVTAERVSNGDCVLVANGDSFDTVEVAFINAVTKTGIFAPVTDAGTVVVSDVAASCFVDIQMEPVMKFAAAFFSWVPTWLAAPNDVELSPLASALIDTVSRFASHL